MHFPNTGWARPSHDTIDALIAHKAAHGMLGIDATVASLLDVR